MYLYHFHPKVSFENYQYGKTFRNIREFHGWNVTKTQKALEAMLNDKFIELRKIEQGVMDTRMLQATCDLYGIDLELLKHYATTNSAVGFKYEYPKKIYCANRWVIHALKEPSKIRLAQIGYQLKQNLPVKEPQRFLNKLLDYYNDNNVPTAHHMHLLINGISRRRIRLQAALNKTLDLLRRFLDKRFNLKIRKTWFLYKNFHWTPGYPFIKRSRAFKRVMPLEPIFQQEKRGRYNKIDCSNQLKFLYENICDKKMVDLQKLLCQNKIAWNRYKVQRILNGQKISQKEFYFLKKLL